MNNFNFHNDTVTINDLWYQSHRTLIEKIAIELDVIDKIEDLSNKFLGDKQKLKKLSDPSKPKRPKSAYLYFCDAKREKVKEENPNIKIGAMMKKLGALWKKATVDEKTKFNEMHKKDKDRYEDEMEEYNLNR